MNHIHRGNIKIAVLSALIALIFAAKVATLGTSGVGDEQRSQLRGTWQVIEFIDHSEKAAPPEEIEGFTFEFQKSAMTIRRDKDDTGVPAEFTIDATKQPMWIDLDTGISSVLEGIFQLKDDRLTICIIAGGRNGRTSQRPTEFKASNQKKHSLFILQRINP
ncbi:MAG TPA: TIGR03067 domain-containing protein [Pirellulaceae bacterium]|nr:TIGR03067 domain-containing protein [Pirellulaceae bacterium]HMO93945.1 TIGR03067 domain-containing protein [Pirellulaceae bacterium]HMP69744.1 TIGR03067 domain-containing protein [Pirellulaceae bacterium]